VNVLSIINEDIGPSPNIILVPIVKTLGGGVGVLLVGRLGDIFGRRWFLIGGQCLGLIGAIMGATAKNVNVLMGSTAFIGEQSRNPQDRHASLR
jgi:MFS family permease